MKQIEYTEEQIVALGGLLHDIGKLLSRCNRYRENIGAKNGTHPESSRQFLIWLEKGDILANNPVLQEIVQRHHEWPKMEEDYQVKHCLDTNTRALAYIISRADNYSSKDRREEGSEGKSYYKTRALDCVLSHLTLEDKAVVDLGLHYQLRPLSPQNILPREFEGNTQSELEDLIYMLITDMRALECYNFNQLFTGMNTLLERYTWCIPADTTKKVSDISLYEHLKTTSAFAQCLYRYYKETGMNEKNIRNGDDKNTMAILAMEIDGLSYYAKHITTSTKANKRLKGKVIYGQLLKQGIKERLLRALELTEACEIWAQEDKLYLVIPNLEKEKKQAIEIIENINHELYKEFDGQLYINNCIIPTSGNEIQKFNNLLKSIKDKLQVTSKYKWSKQIVETPITRKLCKSISRCPVCEENTITKKQNMCNQCELEISLGTHIEKYTMIRWRFEQKQEIGPLITLLKGIPQVEFINQLEVSKLEQDKVAYTKYPLKLLTYPAAIQPSPSITPINPKTLESKTLEDLSDEAVGVPYIGVLKCEIKDLELLYRYGLITEEEGREDSTSISRLSTINTLLQTFFNGFIQHEIGLQNTKVMWFKEQRVKINWGNHSIVDASYKGLTLIGPWNELPAVAKYIKNAINEIVGKNKELKIYIAISLLKKKEPIKQGLENAQYLLSKALEDTPGITVFDTHIDWKNVDTVFKCSEYLYERMLDGVLTQSFVYRLKTYANMMEKYAYNQDIEQLSYMSKLEYDLGRNFKGKSCNGNQDKLEETLNMIRTLYGMKDLNNLNIKFGAKYLKVILNYIVYKQRGE